MDLMDFVQMRKPRSNGTDAARFARLSGGLVNEWERVATTPGEAEKLPGRLREWMAGARNPLQPPVVEEPADAADAIAVAAPAAVAATAPGDTLLMCLLKLADWLQQQGDRPPSDDFATFRRDLLKGIPAADLKQGLRELRDLLSAWIAVSLILNAVLDGMARLTRFLLLLDLLSVELLSDAQLAADTTDTLVWDRIHRRELLASPKLFAYTRGDATVQPCARLVREATVADLFVVRSEWSCYHAGEVASITNTLANSSFEVERTATREEETTTTEDNELLDIDESSSEDRTQTEMSRELQRASALQANLSASVNVSGQYGMVKFGTQVSGGVAASLNESLRQASKTARDVVNKALSRVETRTREMRVHRMLERTVDRSKHVIDNRGNGNANGVYRWVDRIDRYQVFRFPHRLQLEFQLPEPAEFLRWRLTEGRPADGVDMPPPPAFNIGPTSIARNNYSLYALQYRASNLPPPPDETLGVCQVLKADATGEPVKDRNEVFTGPRVQAEATITVPAGYVATSVSFDGVALPMRANWRVESNNDPLVGDRTGIEGFHHISMTVLAGAGAVTSDRSGVNSPGYTVQMQPPLGTWDRSSVRFRDAVHQLPQGLINLAPAMRDKVGVGFVAAGASSAAVTFNVSCRLSDEAFAEWRNTVYDALLAAWQGWDQAWRTSQMQQRTQAGVQGWDRHSSTRNAEIVRDELKRQIIGWLLNEQDFDGRAAMVDRANNWDRTNLALARQHAPVIQFFEQAFEWRNMTYVCYPYYWARESRWRNLAAIEAADPQFASFLRAGSVRVVVPARPGMERAVQYWLAHCKPFEGGPLPLPDEDDYVSIAQEVRDLTAPMTGGEPGTTWEARLSTPMLWLEPGNDLPSNPKRQLGQAPNEPQQPLC